MDTNGGNFPANHSPWLAINHQWLKHNYLPSLKTIIINYEYLLSIIKPLLIHYSHLSPACRSCWKTSSWVGFSLMRPRWRCRSRDSVLSARPAASVLGSSGPWRLRPRRPFALGETRAVCCWSWSYQRKSWGQSPERTGIFSTILWYLAGEIYENPCGESNSRAASPCLGCPNSK